MLYFNSDLGNPGELPHFGGSYRVEGLILKNSVRDHSKNGFKEGRKVYKSCLKTYKS